MVVSRYAQRKSRHCCVFFLSGGKDFIGDQLALNAKQLIAQPPRSTINHDVTKQDRPPRGCINFPGCSCKNGPFGITRRAMGDFGRRCFATLFRISTTGRRGPSATVFDQLTVLLHETEQLPLGQRYESCPKEWKLGATHMVEHIS